MDEDEQMAKRYVVKWKCAGIIIYSNQFTLDQVEKEQVNSNKVEGHSTDTSGVKLSYFVIYLSIIKPIHLFGKVDEG